MFENLTKAEQDEKTKNWKDPIAHTVVATILYRNPRHRQKTDYLGLEFLITKRLKKPELNKIQVHHGGHVKVTDKNLVHAAIREIKEETGYVLEEKDLEFSSVHGPELYRSIITDENDLLKLTILDAQAEPTAPFVLTLFIADVTEKKAGDGEKCDGEVMKIGWMSLEKIIAEYGQSMNFNYFSFLFAGLKKIMDREGEIFPDSSPGTYILYKGAAS